MRKRTPVASRDIENEIDQRVAEIEKGLREQFDAEVRRRVSLLIERYVEDEMNRRVAEIDAQLRAQFETTVNQRVAQVVEQLKVQFETALTSRPIHRTGRPKAKSGRKTVHSVA